MPRNSSIWRRAGRGYYTTMGGKQIWLGDDRRTAEKEFARLILGKSPATHKLTVAEVADLWLDATKTTTSAKSWRMRQWTLQKWIDHSGKVRASDLKPYHVTAWLDSRPSWSANMRALSGRVVKTCVNWAVLQGYLDANPLARFKAGKVGRSPGVTEEDLAKWLACVEHPALMDWIEVALGTGCRPGEVSSLMASGVSLEARTATVKGKTGKRTIWFGDRVAAILGRLMELHPDGALLRTPVRRVAWDQRMISKWFQKPSERSGVSIQPKTLRKVFATRSLRINGEVITARLLGHKGLGMVAEHYYTPEDSDLRAAAEKASAKTGGP